MYVPTRWSSRSSCSFCSYDKPLHELICGTNAQLAQNTEQEGAESAFEHLRSFFCQEECEPAKSQKTKSRKKKKKKGKKAKRKTGG